MRKFILLLSLLLIAITFFAQTAISDSTLIVGYNKSSTHIGKKTIDYCMLSYDKRIESGNIFIVTGVNHCKDNSILKKEADFYEVSYKGESYLIEKNRLSFLDTITDFYKELSSMPVERYNSFRNHAIELGKLHDYNELNNIITFLNNLSTKGIALLNWQIYDESEYTDGTSVSFEVYNPTKKVIKYVAFTVVGYNPVNDIVYQSGKSAITIRGVGPIGPGENAAYSFDYVWHSDLVKTAKIKSIVVTYMDGTTKTVTDYKSIMLSQKQYQYLSE